MLLQCYLTVLLCDQLSANLTTCHPIYVISDYQLVCLPMNPAIVLHSQYCLGVIHLPRVMLLQCYLTVLLCDQLSANLTTCLPIYVISDYQRVCLPTNPAIVLHSQYCLGVINLPRVILLQCYLTVLCDQLSANLTTCHPIYLISDYQRVHLPTNPAIVLHSQYCLGVIHLPRVILLQCYLTVLLCDQLSANLTTCHPIYVISDYQRVCVPTNPAIVLHSQYCLGVIHLPRVILLQCYLTVLLCDQLSANLTTCHPIYVISDYQRVHLPTNPAIVLHSEYCLGVIYLPRVILLQCYLTVLLCDQLSANLTTCHPIYVISDYQHVCLPTNPAIVLHSQYCLGVIHMTRVILLQCYLTVLLCDQLSGNHTTCHPIYVISDYQRVCLPTNPAIVLHSQYCLGVIHLPRVILLQCYLTVLLCDQLSAILTTCHPIYVISDYQRVCLPIDQLSANLTTCHPIYAHLITSVSALLMYPAIVLAYASQYCLGVIHLPRVILLQCYLTVLLCDQLSANLTTCHPIYVISDYQRVYLPMNAAIVLHIQYCLGVIHLPRVILLQCYLTVLLCDQLSANLTTCHPIYVISGYQRVYLPMNSAIVLHSQYCLGVIHLPRVILLQCYLTVLLCDQLSANLTTCHPIYVISDYQRVCLPTNPAIVLHSQYCLGVIHLPRVILLQCYLTVLLCDQLSAILTTCHPIYVISDYQRVCLPMYPAIVLHSQYCLGVIHLPRVILLQCYLTVLLCDQLSANLTTCHPIYVISDYQRVCLPTNPAIVLHSQYCLGVIHMTRVILLQCYLTVLLCDQLSANLTTCHPIYRRSQSHCEDCAATTQCRRSPLLCCECTGCMYGVRAAGSDISSIIIYATATPG
ncbi:hypothetical protein J6590_037513 [Homalodisca vitripennis]|nr:hypothetical protein J6590_037513 [Homalodisca vitripennis]